MRAGASHQGDRRAERLGLTAIRGTLSDPQEQLAFAQDLAQQLWKRALQLQRPAEQRRNHLLAAMMADDGGQTLTTLLTDRIFRTQTPRKLASEVSYLLDALGVPTYLALHERWQLGLAAFVGRFMPKTVARGMERRIRAETSHLLLPSQGSLLARYLAERRAQGVRVNLNHLGEAVLGEAEAERRRKAYMGLLKRRDVEAISVKVSSIFSQVDPLAFEHSASTLAERLRELYRVALTSPFVRADGVPVPKLVNLDMEAYRDMELTLRVFRNVLDEMEFLPLSAGIVLQAYLPDAAEHQRTLTAWARDRIAHGGAPIRLRIVKGANLAMETADSSIRGWPVPIYSDKAAVDANFKRMMAFGCLPENACAVHLGLASHNVFDLALGLTLRAHHGVEAQVGLELLSGMAEPLLRAVREVCNDVLVYAPSVERNSMHTAIAYLVRRLDENTSPDNFLHHSFGMRVGDDAWNAQQRAFASAFAGQDEVSSQTRRTQNRAEPQPGLEVSGPFSNEPDTDFGLAHNRAWLQTHLRHAQAAPPSTIALQIGGDRSLGEHVAEGFDPSRPGIVPYRYALATPDDVERALACGTRAERTFGRTDLDHRRKMLAAVAQRLRDLRGELIAAMVLDAGKRPEQADIEISEAIDFAEFYGRSLGALELPDVELRGRGLTVVTPPWNFPLAIPAGGVCAALAAGNPVILKPAPETVLVASILAEACWEAGVPPEVLQLCLCEDEIASALVRDARVAALILTGATATARLFQRLRPDLHLLAETGGKNAILVSALADRDQTVRDVVSSAFGHAGQKCSAASLLICEAEVYEDAGFREQLRDAAGSLPVGSAWQSQSVVTPLIHPPSGPLRRALDGLDEGESWLLAPQQDPDNPRLVSPGIRWGVQRGAFCHTTELFGPVLSVMRADDLYDGIELANATGYGLTSGLQSLDEREHARWLRRIRAGNVYINRGITGAIVRRQPFGGYGESSYGPGAKAGGPNYVLQLTQAKLRKRPQTAHPPVPAAATLLASAKPLLDPKAQKRLAQAACDFGAAMAQHFGLDHDPSQVIGERNVFRYVPRAPMLVRLCKTGCFGAEELESLLLICCAALSAGAGFALSLPQTRLDEHPRLSTLKPLQVIAEDDSEVIGRVGEFECIRAVGAPSGGLAEACLSAGVYLDGSQGLPVGRLELIKYQREQTVSISYHRHGSLAPARLLPMLRQLDPQRAPAQEKE